MIDCLFSEEIHIPRRYIYSGAWANQASCLYGFFTYGLELSENYKIPSLGVLAITDGDIPEKSIQKRINELIKGNYKNTDQITIQEMISKSISSFQLEFNPENINGLPEYNHKKWFEEITEEKILIAHKNSSQHFLKSEREICTMLELISFSKKISHENQLIINKNGKPDYHTYYDIFKEFNPSNTDHKTNNIHWYILSAIKYYNTEKWKSYTQRVRENIFSSYEEHKNRFLKSVFDFR